MEHRLDRLEDKIDQVQSDIGEIKVICAENTASLKEHMRRTEAVENSNLLLQSLVEDRHKDHLTRLSSVERYVDRAVFLGKSLTIVGALLLGIKELGLVDFIIKLIKLD